MPLQAVHNESYYVLTVPLCHANTDSFTGWASPLYTCNSRGI